jgi:hypothetical protein
MLRADRIANRLHDMWGGKTNAEYDFPPKPKRMRWAIYQRLLEPMGHRRDELRRPVLAVQAASAGWASLDAAKARAPGRALMQRSE